VEGVSQKSRSEVALLDQLLASETEADCDDDGDGLLGSDWLPGDFRSSLKCIPNW